MDFSSEPGPKMGCVIRGRAPATSLSYHESGSHLFVASEKDSVLRIVDCLNGGAPTDRPPMLKLQREGIRTVQSTHHGHCVLFSPGMNDGVPKKNNIYYLSVHDNKIVREFEGHSGVINSISMSPVDDTFLSSGIDGTVRLWDCGKSGSIGELKLPENAEAPLAAFDSTGLVFGVSAAMASGEGYHINLFDARNYTVGPFAEMTTTRHDIESKIRLSGSTPERAYALSKEEWTSMEFNKSGKQILVGANGIALSIDGYEGTVLHSFLTEAGSSGTSQSYPMAACFTADDRSVICGNDDGTVSCYQADSGLLARKLRGHVDRVGAVAVNPKYAQLATACTNTAVW
eukprot:CAMPEP_0172313032 /NCGR_PEP_ID=MMETSP1058-20130122/19177_1 /TAXON_ID=83371 /ORGANISM="Detonula confervacea, Strain CCMP 353" /LENGTH=343 /DNA_ID=CAMNT_0013026617 /DNA_START=60 /DNA_END=1088 /DNA_ORIENTATION=-